MLVVAQWVGRGRVYWYREGLFKKNRFECPEVRRMVDGGCEMRRFLRGNAWGVARGMNP